MRVVFYYSVIKEAIFIGVDVSGGGAEETGSGHEGAGILFSDALRHRGVDVMSQTPVRFFSNTRSIFGVTTKGP